MMVEGIAKEFGVDPILVHAIIKAEGNILKAVQCSLPDVKSEDQAVRILCRSIVHALTDYVNASGTRQRVFLDFLGGRWAPLGAANDPKGLNVNWVPNVRKLWLKMDV